MNRLGANVISQVVGLGDTPDLEKLIGAVKIMLDGYTQDRFDRVYIFYTRFHQHHEAGTGDGAAAPAYPTNG